MIDKIVKKISLSKGVEEEDIYEMIKEFFKLLKQEMAKPELNRMMIHNFISFVPDKGKLIKYKKMIEYMKAKGELPEKIKVLEEIVNNNIDKPLKRKRCR